MMSSKEVLKLLIESYSYLQNIEVKGSNNIITFANAIVRLETVIEDLQKEELNKENPNKE